jgi:pimeloyl-ACP methyl ester carboxylesterase
MMGDAPASVRIDGYTIPFRVMGSGPPVVCSELPLNPFCRFTPLQRKLAASHTVYVVDLRPVVDRAAVDPAQDLLDVFSTTLLKTLDALEIESCALIGSFMFGGVAMETARRAPSRVERLVLIGSLGVVRLPRTWLMRGITGFYRLPGIPRLSRFSLFRQTVEWSDRALLLRLRKKQLFYRPNQVPVCTEDLYEHYGRPRIDAAGWALLWCIRRLRYETLVPRLREISCPTLIVHGTDDLWVPPRYATELQRLLPCATIEWVRNTRHMPELEETDHAFQVIQAFLGVTHGEAGAVAAHAS